MKKVFSIFIFTWALSSYFFLTHAGEPEIRPDTIEASLREGNPKITLEKYFNCEKYEGTAYERIASGLPNWVSLAEKILQISDACYTEGIQSSLGKAMQIAPHNVLPLVDKTATLSASYICLPFISNELSIKSQLAEVIKSKNAIEKVHDKNSKKQKESCLRFIKAIESDLIKQQTSTADK